jgi:hypothetical protein
MASLLAGVTCPTQNVCSFDNESLRSSSRTVSARLAAGLSNDGIAANLGAIAFRQTSQIVAVLFTVFNLEAKGRVVRAGGVITRRDWSRDGRGDRRRRCRTADWRHGRDWGRIAVPSNRGATGRCNFVIDGIPRGLTERIVA